MNATGTPVSCFTLTEGYQRVDFSKLNDVEVSVEVIANDVVIIPNTADHDSGSSRVKMRNIVDYTWEERFYTGQLLAVHKEGIYIAYGIKAAKQAGDVVRVVNRATNNRTLIKGMEGAVQDIAFSHHLTDIILACLDMKGNVFIYKVLEDQVKNLLGELVLHILPDERYTLQHDDFFRVSWCPYIPEHPDEEEPLNPEEVPLLLALSRGNKLELWSTKVVTSRYGQGPVKPGEVNIGFIEITEHKKSIVKAEFSPDGTAIATASLDGEIKFFQVYMQSEDDTRCLHQWEPHGGQPLSSLFFLDNHENYNPDIQFWKFAITGANNNSELKVWSCESWKCIQTLTFSDCLNKPTELNVCLDLGSSYLLISDFHHKVLYVLQLYTNNRETMAAVISISEYLLTCPILSFGIVRVKSANSDVCNDLSDEESGPEIFIELYVLQPKSLQDYEISYCPPIRGSVDESSIAVKPPLLFDSLVDITVNASNGELSSCSPKVQELPANHSSLQLNLMTPDAFNSPVKHDTSGSSLVKAHIDETSYSNTTTLVASPHSPEVAENNLVTGNETMLGSYVFASGGSSPSREVQEILGEGKHYFEESEDIQQDQEEQGELLPPPEQKPISTVWPEVPMLRAADVRKNEEQARKSVIQAESSAGAGDCDLSKLNQRLETSISSMIHVMNSLMQASEEQANEIKQLRDEQQNQRQMMVQDIDKIVSRHSQQHTLLLEKILATKDSKQQEALSNTVAQAVINFLSTNLLDSVNKEISRSIMPAVVNQLDSVKHQINVEITQKLSTTDHLLKENITKLVHSKSVMDVLSAAVVSSLTPVISHCYKEYFTSIALPSFERSCAAMFSQINETFSKGSKEFVSTLDSHSRRLSEKNREQSLQMQALSDILKNSTTEMNNEMKKSVASIEKHVMEAVTRALTLQQATLEDSVIAAVRSRTVTPAPHVIDTQMQQSQIIQLINQGQINSAFQQALSASDLSLVVFVCEKVNPQQLFSQSPCPLQQHVLLSLIQQLSADMNNQTEIKHKYLEEALMNLDVNNTVTRDHLPAILTSLQRQLQSYIASNPNNRITRSMRILLMASQAVLTSCLSNSR